MHKKIITINNDKDYKKLLRRLWLYKRYRFTKFKLINNIKEPNIDYLEKGLNIKKRKERITYVFDTCCFLLDDFYHGENICGFKDGKCVVQRELKNGKCNGCCRVCLYVTDKGCPSKNVACKLFNCDAVKEKYKTMDYKDLKLLKLLSIKNQLLIRSDYFTLREEALGDQFTYTGTAACIRMIYRLIRNYIKRKRKEKNK